MNVEEVTGGRNEVEGGEGVTDTKREAEGGINHQHCL